MTFKYSIQVSYWKKDKYFNYGIGASSLRQAIRKIKIWKIKAEIEKLMYFDIKFSMWDANISNW